MGAVYAQVNDVMAVGRALTNRQAEAAAALLEQASARLRLTARRCGTNVDEMIAADEDYGLAVKAVVVQAVCRALDGIGDDAGSGTNVQQSAFTIGAYSASMTYLNAGQSLYFLRSELKELGLVRQRYGLLDVLGLDAQEEE